LGTVVTYRYNGTHASGLPRFARFWRVRADAPPASEISGKSAASARQSSAGSSR